MRSDAPALMPILRSRHLAELLTALLLHPDRGYTLTQLSTILSVPASTLHREVERLLEADLITAEQVGRSRLLRANQNNRYIEPLTTLIVSAFGPHLVLAEEFDGIEGIESMLIYGSWAARYHGVPGPPPHDVDVLVVGRPKRADVYDAAARASDRVGFPVHPTVRSPSQWRSAGDALTQQIKASPVVQVSHGEGRMDDEVDTRRSNDRTATAIR